jgi:uncharacterized protein (TIGR03067 family)
MRRFMLLLALLSLAFAPIPKPKPDKREGADVAKQVEGTWQGPYDRLRIDKGRMRFATVEYALTIDTTKRPWAYDITRKGDARERYLGIFKVEGDTLILSYDTAERGRPTAFEGAGRGAFREVYRRVKR